MGVDRHQQDIFNLRSGINELAGRMAAGGPLPWQAISQIMVLGCVRPDGSSYTVYPDVAVFAHPLDSRRGSFALEQDGSPVLVIEVASASTVKADLDMQRGKGWSYARAAIAEYLVLDPSGELIPEGGSGWQVAHGTYRPWQPEASGRWRSGVIELSLGVEGGLAAVYDLTGRRQLREGEVTGALVAREREGHASGLAEGLLEGKRMAARQVARARFGVVAHVEARIDAASASDLDYLLGRLPIVDSVEDL